MPGRQPSDGNVLTVLHSRARPPSPLTIEMMNVTSSTPYTHDSAVSATTLRTTMRKSAGSSRGTLTPRAGLGNPETSKRSLDQERAKHLPKNPNSVRDLVLEDEWTKTSNGDHLLVYDNGVDSSNWMLVFGTDDGLCHLASSTTWFLDGTFKIAPSLFTQLCVIRAPLGDASITCVYRFLINKDLSTYEEFLSAVHDRIPA